MRDAGNGPVDKEVERPHGDVFRSTFVLEVMHALERRRRGIICMAKGVVDGDSPVARERSPFGVYEEDHVDVVPKVVLGTCGRAPPAPLHVIQQQEVILHDQAQAGFLNRPCKKNRRTVSYPRGATSVCFCGLPSNHTQDVTGERGKKATKGIQGLPYEIMFLYTHSRYQHGGNIK